MGGPDQNPNFLKNFCLLEMRLEKKVSWTCPNIQEGGGVKAVQKKSKVKLLFSSRGLPNLMWCDVMSIAVMERKPGWHKTEQKLYSEYKQYNAVTFAVTLTLVLALTLTLQLNTSEALLEIPYLFYVHKTFPWCPEQASQTSCHRSKRLFRIISRPGEARGCSTNTFVTH